MASWKTAAVWRLYRYVGCDPELTLATMGKRSPMKAESPFINPVCRWLISKNMPELELEA